MGTWDIFIVRMLPFVLYAISLHTTYEAFQGIDEYPFNLFHSHSAIYGLALFLISLANKKYHCVYNRAMYVFLIVVPVINWLDGIYNLFPCIEHYIIMAHIVYGTTAIVTAYLAINHFIKVLKLKRKFNARNARNTR